MTVETQYNLGDQIWFHFTKDEPLRGEIIEVFTKKKVNEPVKVDYRVNYKRNPTDVDIKDAILKQEEVYPSIAAYLEQLNKEHQGRIKRLQDVMNGYVTPFAKGGVIVGAIHSIV